MISTKQWLTTHREDGVHVVPLDDVVQHEFHEDCICGPTPELVQITWMYTHHSADGREFGAEVDPESRS